MNKTIKCDACGQFISYKALESGKAMRSMVTPDSDYSYEEWETLCSNCLEDEDRRKVAAILGVIV